MAHRFTFLKMYLLDGMLSEQDVRDVVDTFFRWDDSSFRISGQLAPQDKKSDRLHTMGDHFYDYTSRTHVINLYRENLLDVMLRGGRMGGNHPPPIKDSRLAAGMVLLHEIQHANQVNVHRPGEAFYASRKKYSKRPAEREARSFVDDNLGVLSDVLACRVPETLRSLRRPREAAADQVHGSELDNIADVLGECEEVSVGDIVEELRSSSLSNPVNVERISQILRGRGVKIS